jgi:hypothetical protein
LRKYREKEGISYMARRPNYAAQLRKIISSLEQLAEALEKQGSQSVTNGNGRSSGMRTRRSKKEVAALKKMLKAERKAGVPVAELAEKHGVSTAYIYMLQ